MKKILFGCTLLLTILLMLVLSVGAEGENVTLKATDFASGGTITLTGDSTLSEAVTLTNDTVINLKGKTLTFSATITVNEGINLTIYSDTAGAVINSSGTMISGTGNVFLGGYTAPNVKNAEWKDNLSASSGVVTNLSGDGQVSIYGGTYDRTASGSNGLFRFTGTSGGTFEEATVNFSLSDTTNAIITFVLPSQSSIRLTKMVFNLGNKKLIKNGGSADDSCANSILMEDCDLSQCSMSKFVFPTYLTVIAKGTNVFGKAPIPVTLDDSAPAYLRSSNSTVYRAGENVTMSNTTLTPLGVSQLDGASIRTLDPSGLRFESTVDEALIAKLTADGADFTVGTLIYPTDLLGSNALTLETANALNLEFSSFAAMTPTDGKYDLKASITGILAQNYCRAFSARSYIKIGGDVWYTDYSADKNSRSIYEVAKAVYADADSGLNNTQKETVKSFLDGVVEIPSLEVGNVTLAPIPGYVNPHTVTYSDSILTVTAGNSVKSIILEGKIYTGGWNVADDVLTAEFEK